MPATMPINIFRRLSIDAFASSLLLRRLSPVVNNHQLREQLRQKPAELLVKARRSAKRERKGLDARIKELDLKESISCPTFLPNELIHSRLPDLAGPIGIAINSVIFARSGAIQLHSEAHRLTVFWRS